MIKLSELRAARAAMTQGEWAADRVPGMPRDDDPILATVICLELDDRGRQQQIADCYDNTSCSDERCAGNAAGIAVMHNAADVLIEVASAALALERAKDSHAIAAIAVATSRGEGAKRNQLNIASGHLAECRRAYAAALAKVEP